MSDPLAIRIEAALAARQAEIDHMPRAAESVRDERQRLITGMRAILQVVPEIEDMEGQIQGEWGLSTDDPAEINECSNALLRTLASMLGIETNEETND